MQEYRLYINLILEMIQKIESSISADNKKELMQNTELQDATLMRLQVIGENVKNLPLKIKKQYPEIKWDKFERLRNLISHKYASINYNLIWSFIENNLEELKSKIINIK